MKNILSNNKSMFEINYDLYPEFLINLFKNIDNGNLINSLHLVYSILPNYLKETHPNLIDYTPYKPTEGGILGRALMHTYKVVGKKLTLTEYDPFGISLNQTMLNNLVNTRSKAEQFKSLLKLSACIFHEAKHVDDYINAKKQVSSEAYNILISHLASISNGKEYYNTSYYLNHIETSAYSHQHISAINLGEVLSTNSSLSEDSIAILSNYIISNKIKLYQSYLNEISPIKLDKGYSHKSIVNAKLLKSILKESPHLLSQFKVLNLKYQANGEEKDLTTLLSERESQLYKYPENEQTDINSLYSQLIFEKLALSTNEELIGFLKNSSPEEVQLIIDLSSSFVTSEINKENVLQRNCCQALEEIIHIHPNEKSAIEAYGKAKTTKLHCEEAHSEMISVVENFKKLATTNSNNIECNQNVM